MKPSFKWLALALGIAVLSLSVGRAIQARKHQQAELARSAATEQDRTTRLSERDLYTVQAQPLQPGIAVSGNLSAQRTAIVKAKVAAELLRLSVREGDAVRQGQELGQLDPQEFQMRLQQARQQAASARAIWQNAELTLRNHQALVNQGFISRQALDNTASNAASTRATYEAAQAAVELAEKAVRDAHLVAPLSGQVSQRFAQAGERVPVEGRIVEIVDLDSLEWQVALSPQDLSQVRIGSAASLRLEGLAETLSARVVRINPSAAPDTRAVLVYLSLPRHPALRHGLFAQGEIHLPAREVLAIPTTAIRRDSGQDQVLSLQGTKVVRVPVQLGARARSVTQPELTLVEVRQGLKVGDRILADAAGTVQDGQRVTLPTPGSPPASAAR